MSRSNRLRPGWSPVNIGLMVLGFVVFWPLGLAMLAYINWGDDMKGMFGDFQRRMGSGNCCGKGFSETGNVAFDDYRRSEMKRLDEERKRLEQERGDFEEFLRNLHRAKDQEEFDRFMKNRSNSSNGTNHDDGTVPEASPA